MLKNHNFMIPVARPDLSGNEKLYVNQAVERGWVSSLGEFIEKFELGLKNYLDVNYLTTCSNGTTALHLALLGLGIKAGDEVILPASSFVATLNAVLYTGATPVFVDVDLETWGMNSNQVKEKITSKTKAILAVHLYGFSCDIKELSKIAKENNIYLIEDNAESFGGTCDGKKLGTIGDIGIFSFFGNKIITTGEGGAVCCHDEKIMEKILIFKNHGRKTNKVYFHESIGYNYRMTNLQAAIGLAQLERVEDFLKIRQKIENFYDHLLSPYIQKQKEKENTRHVNWLYAALAPKGIKIDDLSFYLEENGIDSRRLFYPMNKMPYLSENYISQNFPIAEEIYERGFNLPTFTDLKNEEMEKIGNKLLEYFKRCE